MNLGKGNAAAGILFVFSFIYIRSDPCLVRAGQGRMPTTKRAEGGARPTQMRVMVMGCADGSKSTPAHG
jgi:hypothetical protein